MTDPVTSLPGYDELPPAPNGGRLGWGVFGADDQLGLMNLLTPERRAGATALVRRGVTFSLDLPMGAVDPPLNPNRRAPAHRIIEQKTIGFDDAWDDVYPQSGSQWDSLAHVGYDRETYYNGATAADIRAGRRNTIDRWAERGIVGRGVLLDLAAVATARDPSYSPASPLRFGVEELEESRRRSGVELKPGDILILHTGYTAWYLKQPDAVRTALPGHIVSAGIEPSEDVARWLWNQHCAAVAADNFSVEVWPANFDLDAQPFGFLHQMLIGSFGMALGELWWLDELVEDCRRDGVYEGLLASAPLAAPGGIGSPANTLFLK